MKNKYYVQLEHIQDDKENMLHCLTESDETDTEKVGDQYAKNYWGEPDEDDEPVEKNKLGYYENFCGEIWVTATKVKQVTDEQYEFLNDLFYGA